MDSSNFEAKTTKVVVTETAGRSASISSSQISNKDDWVTGVRKRMPWTGIGALVFVILSSVGQMLVLLYADRHSASEWPEYITPNICLSILNGVASLAIAFAVVQGIAIAWWRKALLGASIKELHYTWSFSNSITSVLLKFKYFNTIALAALMAKIAIIDGILFQRSIGTFVDISWQEPKPIPISAWSQEDFPVTGMMGATNNSDGQMTTDFSRAVINWIETGYGVNTYDYNPYCLGFACLYGLSGAGFAIECQDSNSTDDFVYTATNRSGSSNKTIYDIDFAMKYPDTIKNYSRIEMTALWPVSEPEEDGSWKCPTTFTSTICEFRPSILNYTMFYVNSSTIEKSKMRKDSSNHIQGVETIGPTGSQLSYSCLNASQASLGLQYNADNGGGPSDGCGTYNSNLKQVKGVEVLQQLQIHEQWEAGAFSKLLGIYNAMKDTFRSEAVLVHSNGTWSVSQTGMQAPVDMSSMPQNNTFCNYTYNEPRDEIFTGLNLLMAQVSTRQDLWPEETWWNNATGDYIYNRRPKARQYYKDIYYLTHNVYMGIALGLTAFVILCIMPSYWGFWQLGRDVTLGPLEIAYAFQGPAFSAVHNVNGNADAVIKTAGKTRIQYGEVLDGDGKRLAFKVT